MAGTEPLTLYYHPLASYCWKVLIALYENDTPFAGRIVNFGEERSRAEFLALWPVGKFPVLRDERRGRTLPETTIIIEYLDEHYPGAQPLLPREPEPRLEARLWDRLFDLYVHAPMQKLVSDHMRAEGERDARGVAEARATLATAYELIARQVSGRSWAGGGAFTIADCAAAPALFYAGIVLPFAHTHPPLAGYFERLVQRPAVARVIAEARPYFPLFPFRDSIPRRFLG